MDYQPDRDDPMLRQLNQMSAQQCQALLTQLDQPELERQPGWDQVRPEPEMQQQVQVGEATRLVEEIWQHSRVGLAELDTVGFEDYQIQLDPTGQPELYRLDEKILERSGEADQSSRLTQIDLERLQAWQQLTMQQYHEQIQRQAAREKEQEQEKERMQQAEAQEKQATKQPERSPFKAPDLER